MPGLSIFVDAFSRVLSYFILVSGSTRPTRNRLAGTRRASGNRWSTGQFSLSQYFFVANILYSISLFETTLFQSLQGDSGPPGPRGRRGEPVSIRSFVFCVLNNEVAEHVQPLQKQRKLKQRVTFALVSFRAPQEQRATWETSDLQVNR